MGYVTCGVHGVRCCWSCDRCPKCEPETGKIGRGDYCNDCKVKLVSSGHVWSDYYQNYVPRDAQAKAEEYDLRVRALEEEGLTRSDAQAVVDAEDLREKERTA
jgi:hypothetical protein